MKRILFSKNTFFILLYSLLSLRASAQENTPIPVTELMDGAIPEGAIKLDNQTGYQTSILIDNTFEYYQDNVNAEYYQKDNIILCFFAGRSVAPFQENSLKKTWAATEEMAGRDTNRVRTDDDENIVKKINNYEVLKTHEPNSTMFFYYLISHDKVSYLNFIIAAKPEDLEKAKALGESMLNSMKFK
jgi:hypothetical protein